MMDEDGDEIVAERDFNLAEQLAESISTVPEPLQ